MNQKQISLMKTIAHNSKLNWLMWPTIKNETPKPSHMTGCKSLALGILTRNPASQTASPYDIKKMEFHSGLSPASLAENEIDPIKHMVRQRSNRAVDLL